MRKESTRFKNRTWDVAADVRLLDGCDPAKKYPAIICAHPISSCKEQTSGNVYAERLIELGYVTLAFDASHQGRSGGEPRYLKDPARIAEDR
ncbi:alpha/beta hydrolase [Streptomyces sp. NPDC127117]|uniref:alpha/beta hydrolase n=1 Tax=Streptomyces sp. NPDC127117 TaxID=3345368 RepID=UPI0036449395